MGHPVRPLLLSLLLFCALSPARAASVTSTWLGGTGSWTDPAQWSGSVVPQNTTTDSFDVAIDGGNPEASEVTLDAQDTIGSLQIDAADSLVVTATGLLTLDVGQISGGGSIRLDGGGISGPQLANQDDRIAGWGTIGAGGSDQFTNYGVVEADVAGQTLQISGARATNFGTLRAIHGGNLRIAAAPGGLLNDGGTVEAVDGSTVGTGDFTASLDGTFSASRHGAMNLAGSFTRTRFTTDADSLITFYSIGACGLSDVTLDGQIQMNGTAVDGTLTNLGVIRGALVATDSTTVVNHGEITFQADVGAMQGELALTGGGTVTLDPSAPVRVMGPFRNVDNDVRGAGSIGTLLQNGGVIEASGGVLRVGGTQTDHTGVFGSSPGATLEMAAIVTGSGAWRADGGQIHVTGDVGTTGDIEVLHGGALAVDTAMSGGNLVVDGTGSLDVQGLLRIARNLDFDGPNAGRWLFGPSASLATQGAGGAALGDWSDWQSFETAGLDLGFVGAGFTNGNFYLPELVIGSDGRLVLRDRRDNGNRAGGAPEALYVDTLVFSDSLGLLDLNGLSLYYNHLVGSPDQIIDVAAPEPGTTWLVGAALAVALAARRRTA